MSLKIQPVSVHKKTWIYWFIALGLMMPWVAIAQQGTLEWDRITSPALEGNLLGDSPTRSFAVYLPPSYETSDQFYPSVYVLHGFGGNAGSHTNMQSTADVLIRNGDIGEMILVFVDGSNRFGGSIYNSSETIGDYETYIVRDLVDHVDANYRTFAQRESRGITGFSMGGVGSMHLSLKYPEVFSAVDAYGGAYDLDDDWWTNLSRAAAYVNVTDWGSYNSQVRITFSAFVYAYSAVVSPNPDNPPFYMDKPYELVNGKAEVIPERWQRHVERSVVHNALQSYVNQPLRMSAIRFVHGTGDGVVAVSQARLLDAAMTELGVPHIYDEHNGGHDFYGDQALKFLAEHLAFELFTNVDSHAKLATTWSKMK